MPLVFALALAACEQSGPTSPDHGDDPIGTVLAATHITIEQCATVDFDGFAHGDAVTAMNVLGVPLTLSAIRYAPDAGAVNPTAYDVELTDPDLAALDATHDDTQAGRDCADCVGHGSVLVVPDADFAAGGDHTNGGEILITGFAADTEGTWEIERFDVVDGDANQGFTRLYVDGGLSGINTRTGNATVETVAADPNTITTQIEFIIGEQEPTSGGIDNIRLCRSTTEEHGGGEGCTPGYWRQDHHYDSWVGYDPSDLYSDVFGVGPAHPLGETVQAGGGGEAAFLRHSTAALLNSTSISYDMSEGDVIALVQDTYAAVAGASSDKEAKQIFNDAKDTFAAFNEQSCPLN